MYETSAMFGIAIASALLAALTAIIHLCIVKKLSDKIDELDKSYYVLIKEFTQKWKLIKDCGLVDVAKFETKRNIEEEAAKKIVKIIEEEYKKLRDLDLIDNK